MAAVRLLCTASSLHSALGIVTDGEPNQRLEDRLSAVLVRSSRMPMLHWDCLARQLVPDQAGTESPREGQDAHGIAVAQAGVAFWRKFVSRGFRIPEAELVGDSCVPGGGDQVVKVEAATSCLLLTVQRLLVLAVDRNVIVPFDDAYDSAGDALWVVAAGGAGQWVESPEPRDALTALHLEIG